MNMTFDFSQTTQYGGNFAVNCGHPGRLTPPAA